MGKKKDKWENKLPSPLYFQRFARRQGRSCLGGQNHHKACLPPRSSYQETPTIWKQAYSGVERGNRQNGSKIDDIDSKGRGGGGWTAYLLREHPFPGIILLIHLTSHFLLKKHIAEYFFEGGQFNVSITRSLAIRIKIKVGKERKIKKKWEDILTALSFHSLMTLVVLKYSSATKSALSS